MNCHTYNCTNQVTKKVTFNVKARMSTEGRRLYACNDCKPNLLAEEDAFPRQIFNLRTEDIGESHE